MGIADTYPNAQRTNDRWRSYIDQGTPPVALTAAHFGDAATPAWLLPVAVVCPNAASAAEETYRLSAWAQVPGPGIPACVAYIKLTALLLGAVPTEEAIEAATGHAPRQNTRFPEPLGQREADTLAISIWALMDPNGMATAMALTPPWACAAAAGLVGICKGLDAMPASWHHHLAATGVCLDLAYGLLRSRANGATQTG